MRAALLFFLCASCTCVPEPGSTCSATTCSGCCDPSGTCRSGDSPLACGVGGRLCGGCNAGDVCLLGACVAGGTGGGASGGGAAGGGVAGGAAGGSAGGAAGGSAGGSAGGAAGGAAGGGANPCVGGEQPCNGSCVSTCFTCPAAPRPACSTGFQPYTFAETPVSAAAIASTISNARVRIDATSTVHAAWTRRTVPVLIQYASNGTGSFVVETVAQPSAQPSATVSMSHLALGDCGAPAVAYLRRHVPAGAMEAVQQAYVALKPGTAWVEELIPVPTSATDMTPAPYVDSIDVAVDAQGTLHVAAKLLTWGGAFYLHRSAAGAWTSEYVALPVQGIRVPVISWSPSLGPLLAWGNAPTVAYRQGAAWVTSTVPNARPLLSTAFNDQPEIQAVADRAGNITLAWGAAEANGSDSLYVSHRTGTTWSTPQQVANASGWAADALNLWVGSDDLLRMTYEAYATGGSVTPFWAVAEDGNWFIRSMSVGVSGGGVATTDSTGRLYLLAFDNMGVKLRAQSCTVCSGGFCPQLVAGAAVVGDGSSIAVDAAGNPVIAFHDQTRGDLRLAHGVDGGWTRETVDAPLGASVGIYNSVKLDATGKAVISYWDVTNNDLKLARWSGSAWSTQTVDAPGSVGGFNSLALDTAGAAHVAYFDLTNGDLKYAHETGAGWQLTAVDTGGDVGRYASLALDGQGRPHIAYTDTTNADLKHASWSGTGWNLETVDSTGSVGQFASLALDAAGRPRITYFDGTNNDLKYAEWSGTAWTLTSIATMGTSGLGSALALDASGTPHVLFNEGSTVKYTHRVGTAWPQQTLDTFSNTCTSLSIAIDALGRVHVSYCDPNNGDLRYAWQ